MVPEIKTQEYFVFSGLILLHTQPHLLLCLLELVSQRRGERKKTNKKKQIENKAIIETKQKK